MVHIPYFELVLQKNKGHCCLITNLAQAQRRYDVTETRLLCCQHSRLLRRHTKGFLRLRKFYAEIDN